MEPEELARLTLHYESLSDEDLRDAYDVGPAAHRDQQVWQIVEREFESRGLGKASDNTETLQWDAGSDSFVTVPDSGPDGEPRGLGGWLVLVAIGLIITPLRLGLELTQAYIPIFAAEYWSVLTDPSSEAYHPLLAPLIVFGSIGHLVLIAVAVAGMVLFFRRSPAFPKLMVSFYLGGLGFVAIDLFGSSFIPDVAATDDQSSLRVIIQSISTCVIWIPYMYRSRRVRNTFLQTVTDGTPPLAPVPASAQPVHNLGGEWTVLSLGAAFTALIVLGTLRPVPTSDLTLRLTLEIDESAGVIAERDQLVEQVIRVLDDRIEAFDIGDALIENVGDGRIAVELAGVDDPVRAKALLEMQGRLEFRFVDTEGEFTAALGGIDAALQGAGVTVDQELLAPSPPSATQQILGQPDSATRSTTGVFSQTLYMGSLPGEYLVREEASAQVDRLVRHPALIEALPPGVDLLWGSEPLLQDTLLLRPLYAVESRPIVTGEQVMDATAQIDPMFDTRVVTFELTRAGGRIFARETARHINDYLAIVLDGRVQGQPPIIRSAIGRRGQIELGSMSIQEAQDLAVILRVGPLPAPIRVVEESLVNRNDER